MRKPKATSELKTYLLLEATRLDSQATLSQPSGRPSVKAHAHDFESTEQTYSMVTNDSGYYSLPLDFHGDFQDYAVYHAGRTPDPSTRLPTPAWQTLSKPGMKAWLNLPAEDKKKLVACLLPDLLPEQPPDPNLTKHISRRAYEHSIASDQDPAPPTILTESTQLTPDDPETNARTAFHASLGTSKEDMIVTAFNLAEIIQHSFFLNVKEIQMSFILEAFNDAASINEVMEEQEATNQSSTIKITVNQLTLLYFKWGRKSTSKGEENWRYSSAIAFKFADDTYGKESCKACKETATLLTCDKNWLYKCPCVCNLVLEVGVSASCIWHLLYGMIVSTALAQPGS
eukprot:jgi/Psemu1/19778/gm1.19778_g